ncbi:MAG: bacteriocin [Clostridia bacterium]|nr:bacteriocin [Clostridia bacterium]
MNNQKSIMVLSENELENISGGHRTCWERYSGGFCESAGNLTAISIFSLIAIAGLFIIKKFSNKI